MSASLDLNLLPVARYAGRDYPELLGLYYAEPPRRTARGRNLDRLILYLVIEGNAPLPPGKRDQILADLAKLYYGTPGSVTTGLRKTAEELNELLLERNRGLGGNRQCLGLLTQAVVRENQVTLAQSGPMHAFRIAASGSEHFYNPDMLGQGLGLSRTAPVSFVQYSLQPNDTLLLAAVPAPDWSAGGLSAAHGQGPEGLRRRLFSQSQVDLNALVIQAKLGKGKFFLLHPAASQATPPSSEAPKTVEPTVTGKVGPVPPVVVPTATAPAVAVTMPDEQGAASSQPEQTVVSLPAELSAQPVAPATEAPQPAASPAAVPAAKELLPAPLKAAPRREARRGRPLAQVLSALMVVGAPLGKGLRWVGTGLRTLFSHMLPDEAFQSIPSTVMAFIAIAVPVVVVAAAFVTYSRLGRGEKYQQLSDQAKQVALQAMDQTDLAAKRSGLEQARSLIQSAESYASPEAASELKALQVQVRNALDELDFVRRVNYQPAIVGGLPVTSNITRMAAFDDELYMLDGTSGGVLRAYMTGKGYEMDYTFQCSPGTYGEVTVGPLNDIVAWPAGYDPAAKILAVDTAGNALYCAPEQSPKAERLKSAPGDAWGNILASTLDQGDFYALDLPSNGVWIYWRSKFDEDPTLFFDQEIPSFQDVIDMVVDRDELYLLHSDGSLMLCVRNSLIVAPTRCSMVTYTDRRPGKENLPLTPPVPFSQMLVIQPPDPSIFMLMPAGLNGDGPAVYHFSLRNLSFQKQFLAETPLPNHKASAFAVDHSRGYLILALGNEVYYAALP
jgi:hypothetical protein